MPEAPILTPAANMDHSMRKILVVEDHERHRELLARRLRARGFEVIEAENGLRALELAEAELPGMVLMDLKLPDLDGLAVARRLQEAHSTREIPIIAVSACDLGDEQAIDLEAGFVDFEAKPLSFQRLLQKIERLCR